MRASVTTRRCEANQRLLDERKLPRRRTRPRAEENIERCFERPRRPGTRRAAPARAALGDLLPERLELGRDPARPRPARGPSSTPSIAADGDGFRLIVRSSELPPGRRRLPLPRTTTGRSGPSTTSSARPRSWSSRASSRSPTAGRGPEPAPAPRSRAMRTAACSRSAGRWYGDGDGARPQPRTASAEIALLDARRRPDRARRPCSPVPSPGATRRTGCRSSSTASFTSSTRARRRWSCAATPFTGRAEEVVRHEGPAVAREFRGGSQGVPVADGHLFAIHEVEEGRRGRRYHHRLVLLDHELASPPLSPRFSFTDNAIELCAGLARRGDELVFSLRRRGPGRGAGSLRRG